MNILVPFLTLYRSIVESYGQEYQEDNQAAVLCKLTQTLFVTLELVKSKPMLYIRVLHISIYLRREYGEANISINLAK